LKRYHLIRIGHLLRNRRKSQRQALQTGEILWPP
jgi:hypothetical protein